MEVRELLKKFEVEGEGEVKRGCSIEVLGKNYFNVCFRYIPHFGGSRKINYYVKMGRKYAYIEKIYISTGPDTPHQNYGRIKVAKEDIINIIESSKDTEELYDKIERLFEWVAFGDPMDDLEEWWG